MAKKKTRLKRNRPVNRPESKPLLLPMNEPNLEKLCTVLKRIHDKLDSVFDVMIVVWKGLEDSPLGHDEEAARVLQKYATDPLYGEMVELRYTIRQLGAADLFAETEYEEEDEDARNSSDRSFE